MVQREKQHGAPLSVVPAAQELSPLETRIDRELEDLGVESPGERTELLADIAALRSGFGRIARDTLPASAAPSAPDVAAEDAERDAEFASAIAADDERLRSEERKRTPLCTGLLDYAPDALHLIAYASEDELPPAEAEYNDLEDIAINALMNRDRDGAPQWREYRKMCLASLAILHRELTGDPPAHIGLEVCDLRPGMATLFATHFLAFEAVAQVSWHGNNKHNPGQPLHHAREKSTDHGDCFLRHTTDNMIDPGGYDGKFMHAAAAVWRALVMTQIALERSGAKKARGAR